MDKIKSYNILKKFAQKESADLFGVADIRTVKNEFQALESVSKGLDKAVCLGVRLSTAILSDICNAPTRLYFHHYRTVNVCLDQMALRMANFIQRAGYAALPIPASIILDWEKQSAHLSHKKLGVLAGLGWIGRNNLLVNEKIGSQMRLATILTDLPIKTDKPSGKDCGACCLCVKACPAQAIKESPVDFDHIKCFEKLKEFQRQKLVDQYICGVCVNVCKGRK